MCTPFALFAKAMTAALESIPESLAEIAAQVRTLFSKAMNKDIISTPRNICSYDGIL